MHKFTDLLNKNTFQCIFLRNKSVFLSLKCLFLLIKQKNVKINKNTIDIINIHLYNNPIKQKR